MSFSSTTGREPTADVKKSLPSAFLFRRLHSLTGLGLTLFLIEHLVTNSQAALWIGGDGIGFVRLVERIHALPYLPLIEWGLLGVPFLVHLFLGIRYAREASPNSFDQGAHKPYMPYARSRAFTFQRVSAWLLAIGVFAHIVHLRILKDPVPMNSKEGVEYVAKVHDDEGLRSVCDRLEVKLWDKNQLQQYLHQASQALATLDEHSSVKFERAQKEYDFVKKLSGILEGDDERLITSPSIGRAMLFIVRDVFQSIGVCLLYSFLVLGAVYHTCNGLWTAFIKWGLTPSISMQRLSFGFCAGLMLFLTALGFCAIWLTYWVNLVR